MARELPAGTVTFLFTDIEGSTGLLDQLGSERYADALADHRRIVRAACAAHGGVEVDTQGDAFFVAFPTAGGALAAAETAQKALSDGPIRVRMAVHTGTPHLTEEGYVGADVHRAARIAAVAHGGQILVSSSTASLVDPGCLRDLGEHRLKDLTRPQQLYQLVAEGLRVEFPPLRTLDRVPTNLPIRSEQLIGRDRELEEARGLLEHARLLTLTGPGGTGKTRLAIELAADVSERFEGGVYFVDLAEVEDPDLVVPVVAQALGLRERSGLGLRDVVAEHLAGKPMLVLLDNVERVVAAAPDVSRWLAAAPDSKILATSRHALRVSGEQEYPVPPLRVDAAVDLFTERARAVRPEFALNGERSAVVEICSRLDALPLAIELAAARVKLLPPAKLLERLDQALSLLTGGPRDAPERHRTLRAAIDWSFGLLDPGEQELFARLSVFAGGFTLEAAEAVCEASLDGLASLVEKSLLIQREDATGEPRFALLETVREYARGRLDERGETAHTADRHAAYFLALAEAAGGDAPEKEDVELGRLVATELENVRRALAWFRESRDGEREVRLATVGAWALWTFTTLAELREWVDSALNRVPAGDDRLRAEALGAAGLVAANQGDREGARAYGQASLDIARELGDKRLIEWALRVLSFDEPDLAERRRLLEECEELLRELGHDSGLGWVTFLRGTTFFDEKCFDEARSALLESAEIFHRLGQRWEETNARTVVGYVLLAAGRPEEAWPFVEEALVVGRELSSVSLLNEAFVAAAAIRIDTDPDVAARLLGTSSAVTEERGQPVDPRYALGVLNETKEDARSRLGDGFEHEWEIGRALSVEDAVALALGEGR